MIPPLSSLLNILKYYMNPKPSHPLLSFAGSSVGWQSNLYYPPKQNFYLQNPPSLSGPYGWYFYSQ